MLLWGVFSPELEWPKIGYVTAMPINTTLQIGVSPLPTVGAKGKKDGKF